MNKYPMAVPVFTDQNFTEQVIKSNLPVVIDFWATWCPPCKMIEPIVDELAKEFEGKVVIGKMDADENPDVVGQLSVMSLPTMVFFKKGQPVKSLVGAQGKQSYKHTIEEVFGL
jgi:thioredoxin 1